MGYSVYWANGRWQGYGVPAYCDYPGCREEIDRGMGYQHPVDAQIGPMQPEVFTCNTHRFEDINAFTPDDTPEHQEWIKHVSTDQTWSEWREQHKAEYERLTSDKPDITEIPGD